FIQIDTTNVLFICGGAFEGLEQIIEQRVRDQSMGFRATIESKKKRKLGDILAQIMPEDLLKFGLIPEFVGRLPVVVTLDSLDEESLVQILTEPRNALVKQYQKIFAMDGVDLVFTKEAIASIAREAQKRKTGARALRSIMEENMLDIMYEIPSLSNVTKCIITPEVIESGETPTLIHAEEMEEKAS
ncbi:MAG: AAA family ATPase, partial [Candidatus Eremiobacteraeota bacterium]|nr:AAA family ATPase [Candidatus Eremiobacteraeota bacterium]